MATKVDAAIAQGDPRRSFIAEMAISGEPHVMNVQYFSLCPCKKLSASMKVIMRIVRRS